MTEKYKTATFNKSIAKKLDDLPDHILQQINDACASILKAALLDNDDKMRDPNIALGGAQKALALLIGRFFKPDQIVSASENMCKAIVESAKVFSTAKIEIDE